MAQSKSKSSRRWLKRQSEDPYVNQARQEGWRSRAVYKLQELDQRFGLFSQDMQRVVDLGAAPGAWSQYAANSLGDHGRVFALDLLPIDPLAKVECVEGDFTESVVLDRLINALSNSGVNLVMSDMAPNISGMRSVDQPKSMYLAELAFDFAANFLMPGGHFVAKLFQGEGYDSYIQEVRQRFQSVKTIKPKASRRESREMYLVAQEFRI